MTYIEENIRRSGRATKGQHTKSSSPAPPPKAKAAPKQKAQKTKEAAQDNDDYDDEEEKIRCICGDDNPKDKRTFIGCEACMVWQHNVCMGMPDDEDEQPEHYFCEQDAPGDHAETLMAIERGEKIWETRNKIYQNEKKAGAKRKGPAGKARAWLKKDVVYEPQQAEGETEEIKEETPAASAGSKRKRGEEPEGTPQQDIKTEPEEKTTRSSRQDKRRKAVDGTATAAVAPEPEPQPEPELIPLEELPKDRQKIVGALSKIVQDDFKNRVKSGSLDVPEGQTPQSYAERYALRIESALMITHGSAPGYAPQYRALNANLKKNKELIARLLDGSLTAEELSTMSTQDMASEELQKQRAVMKEQLDRQALAIEVAEGPKYRRTHKGDELIEDENAAFKQDGTTSQPVRERTSLQEDTEAGSPTAVTASSSQPLKVETVRSQSTSQAGPSIEQRRQSSQQFDMNNIWAKTAQSPTSSTAPAAAGSARPMQMPPKRRSSVKQQSSQDGGAAGTKEDADVDRMLQDDDEEETYSPAEYADPDSVVWRGKLIQSADNVSPTVNARYVAGRDLTSTVAWKDLLPSHLNIDGRLQIGKAEEYLCSLQWSQSSDVSVLAFTPYDDAEGFETVWKYFRTRERYAVVNKDKPDMVKDLYIIPVDAGQEVPSHVGMLEFNRIGSVVDQKCLLASLVVARGAPTAQADGGMDGAADVKSPSAGIPTTANGQHVLPQHMRSSAPGPAGSPLNAGNATFSPPAHQTLATEGGYAVGLPPNPYTEQPAPPAAALTNPLITEILGHLQYAPTARNVVDADPNISREKLVHLKNILDSHPATRTDPAALLEYLTGNG